MKDVIRLKPPSKVILQQYDFDANMAIIRMDTLIKQLQTVTKPLQTVTFGTPDVTNQAVHDAVYWKKLSETVDSCIERAKRY